MGRHDREMTMSARRLYLQAMSRVLPRLAWPASLEALYYRESYRIRRDADYAPRPDDIFVVSFPKSGTTLLQMMLYQMTTDGEMSFPHIDAVCPWFELNLHRKAGPRFEELPSPRVFKSHHRWGQLPPGGRFIYIARDPCDVVVSAYHHFCALQGESDDIGRFVTRFLTLRPTSWFEHVESWWPHRNDPNVLFLLYGDVVGDLAGTVRRIAAFCGLPVDERSMPRIVERCGIAFMKRHEERFDSRLQRIGRRPEEFIRDGIPGAGRRELTADQQARLSAALDRLARQLGQHGNSLRRDLLHQQAGGPI
jgi:Sulfotransferase domain